MKQDTTNIAQKRNGDIGQMAEHEHDYLFMPGCGVEVCMDCDDHKGLARCYCGWSANGGDGYAQLSDMGETIEEGE